jgi:hypothetical protein
VSEHYQSVSRIDVHFNDGSCAIVKNLGMDANAAISQLQYVIVDLIAENERLRKAGDALAKAAEQSAYHKEDYNVIKAWLAAKESQP